MGNFAGGGGPAFSLTDMYNSLRDDIREAHRDLSEKTNALTERVIEQNSRIGKSEERHLAVVHRLETLERERQHTPRDSHGRSDDQRPVTRREANLVWWTLTGFAGGLVVLWQLGAQVFRMFKP